MNYWLEYTIIVCYLLFLVGMGVAFRGFNRNLDDYIRGGAQGTWWLVGTSILMSGISAFTFTGNAGAAYQAGFTPLIIYFAQVVAFLISAAFLAPWFRQTRVLTPPEIFRIRYGIEVEQFIAYFSFIIAIVTSSIMVWGVATFCSSIFSIPIEATIVGIGLVTVAYSTMGGRWGVLATDFIQSLILFPITILVAFLCLREIGGFNGLFEAMRQPEVARDLTLFKAPDTFESGKYALNWVVATFLMIFLQNISFSNAGKYLSVKDGKEARRAALLAAFLMGVGGFIWHIPPITGRLLYSDAIMAVSLSNPHEASYAIVARHLLPNGLMGIMVVAMFSATMSSLDTGLNGAAGIFVRNMVPPLMRWAKKNDLTHRQQLLAGRYTTLALGAAIIGLALFLSQRKDLSLFDAFFLTTTIIGLPTGVPAIIAVFVRPLPRWSYFFATGCGAIVSITSVVQESFFDRPWSVQERTFWVFAVGGIATLLTIPFYRSRRFASEEFVKRVDAFYDRMRTPVNFSEEVKESRDYLQMRMVSFFAIGAGCFILLLLFLPNPLSGRAAIAFVGGFALAIGALLRFAAHRYQQRTHLPETTSGLETTVASKKSS